MNNFRNLIEINLRRITIVFYIVIVIILIAVIWSFQPNYLVKKLNETTQLSVDSVQVYTDTVVYWTQPAEWRFTQAANNEQLAYGRELIAHTSDFLGPNGTVAHNSNGMNCQNCHLNAGTKVWGNNYFGVAANFPKFRARSGTKENIVKRINDCFERSLNGKGLDSSSKEMQAMRAYIKFIGSDVQKGVTPNGTGIMKLKFLSRAISPENGKLVYEAKCQTCHQADGQGVLAENKKEYTYPPLWGAHSYNSGAGLYRMSNFAGYVKSNMPLGASFDKPQLTDEEAWDVAAFVNSMPRPAKDLSGDWPDISKKPFDHPFGPYSDPFTEEQHKFGPYKPIVDWYKKSK